VLEITVGFSQGANQLEQTVSRQRGANKDREASVVLTPFKRFGPVARLAFGLIMMMAWAGLLGYGLIKLL
jgi:hypothetical protein